MTIFYLSLIAIGLFFVWILIRTCATSKVLSEWHHFVSQILDLQINEGKFDSMPREETRNNLTSYYQWPVSWNNLIWNPKYWRIFSLNDLLKAKTPDWLKEIPVSFFENHAQELI
jgi:hypothetical protein